MDVYGGSIELVHGGYKLITGKPPCWTWSHEAEHWRTLEAIGKYDLGDGPA